MKKQNADDWWIDQISLTHCIIDPARFIGPLDPDEVDGNPRQHDDQPHAAHYRLGVQTEPQQDGPKQQITDGDQQTHLQTERGKTGTYFLLWVAIGIHKYF